MFSPTSSNSIVFVFCFVGFINRGEGGRKPSQGAFLTVPWTRACCLHRSRPHKACLCQPRTPNLDSAGALEGGKKGGRGSGRGGTRWREGGKVGGPVGGAAQTGRRSPQASQPPSELLQAAQTCIYYLADTGLSSPIGLPEIYPRGQVSHCPAVSSNCLLPWAGCSEGQMACLLLHRLGLFCIPHNCRQNCLC